MTSSTSKRVKPQSWIIYITKTRLYNFDPLKPHFFIVKLGFTGVYIIFLISAKNIDCGYSFEPPRRGGSNEYPQSMFLSTHNLCFEQKHEKYWNFLSENFHFLVIKFAVYLNRHVFVMKPQKWFVCNTIMNQWVGAHHFQQASRKHAFITLRKHAYSNIQKNFTTKK